jgi:hypothetical protein
VELYGFFRPLLSLSYKLETTQTMAEPLGAKDEGGHPMVAILAQVLVLILVLFSSTRTVSGAEDFRAPGQHIVRVGVTQSRSVQEHKTFSGCSLAPTLGDLSHGVGWGQVERDALINDSCVAFVYERAVQFDFTLLDSIPNKRIDRVVLSYDETENPPCEGPSCLFLLSWSNGDGDHELKPDGCAVVRVPAFDWINNGGQIQGRLPTLEGVPEGGQAPQRLNARQWDVTTPMSWQLVHSATPLGGRRGHGLLLSGGPSIDDLGADDNTRCLSLLSNITLDITYTVPPGNSCALCPPGLQCCNVINGQPDCKTSCVH